MIAHHPISKATSPLSQNWERDRVREFDIGGLKDGLDIAKCVALGASLGGMAGQFLKAAAVSTEKVIEMMKLTKRQIEVTMFTAGVKMLDNLKDGKLAKQ